MKIFDQATRYQAFIQDKAVLNTYHIKPRLRPKPFIRVFELGNVPAWLGWFFVYTFVLLYFSVSRLVALKSLVVKYSSIAEYTPQIKAAVMALGFLEDFVCTTYFSTLLCALDIVKHAVYKDRKFGIFGHFGTFILSGLLFLVMMCPFIADLLLVVHRDMRFSSGLAATIIREREHLKDAPITEGEFNACYANAIGLVMVATIFGLIRACADWTDLSQWNPTYWVANFLIPHIIHLDDAIQSSKVERSSSLNEACDNLDAHAFLTFKKRQGYRRYVRRQVVQVAAAGTVLVVFPVAVISICSASSPVVASSALNATLNELFANALQPADVDLPLSDVLRGEPWAELFIHQTEQYELFGSNSLYRRTTGFQGDLAFDVDVKSDDPPNVLVIGIESLRFQDSRYLVGAVDLSNLTKGTDLSITPNFDRWAKRGVAFRNIWSSNPTSRSLESILFAQIPYNSAVRTGITGGGKNIKLAGMPQFFKQKEYKTWFTTGSSIDLDGWNVFLPTHGFDTVWDVKTMMKYAEENYGIHRDDWHGTARRGFNWGVHDDISFQILGDLLVNTTREQSERVMKGKPKNPSFITHYTISSHAPYDAWPTWYADFDKPDFSRFYNDHPHASMIKRYLEVRYFTDVELGKFMDRMAREGILNDTIVIITGDHGQAPEADVTNTHEVSMTRVAATIVAEGRLGDAVGLILHDAVEHYDFLNTLADITGVPEEGFSQSGVGRSLKRKVPYGERVIFSNEPNRKLSIVRGHQRLRYDKVSDSMMLHDTESDHAMNIDLFPNLTAEAQAEWRLWRDNGRRLATYFTNRWDQNCLLAVDCTMSGT